MSGLDFPVFNEGNRPERQHFGAAKFGDKKKVVTQRFLLSEEGGTCSTGKKKILALSFFITFKIVAHPSATANAKHRGWGVAKIIMLPGSKILNPAQLSYFTNFFLVWYILWSFKWQTIHIAFSEFSHFSHTSLFLSGSILKTESNGSQNVIQRPWKPNIRYSYFIAVWLSTLTLIVPQVWKNKIKTKKKRLKSDKKTRALEGWTLT